MSHIIREFVSKVLTEDGRLKSWKTAINQVSKQLDLKLKKFLGGGVYGIAYEVEGNKVLKITEDEEEVSAAKHLKGKKNNRLANIYSVYSIKNHKDKKVVVEEKLMELSSDYKKSLEQFDNAFHEYEQEQRYYVILSDILENFNDDFYEYISLHDNLDVNIQPSEIYKELCEIYKEAESKGVSLTDLGSHNLGIKNGHLAMFDIR